MITLKATRNVGYSESIAPRTLNNLPDIKESTRNRIADNDPGMGYYLNWAARSLKKPMTGVIGVFMPGISGKYISAIVKGIEYVAGQSGYSLIFSNSYRPSDYVKLLDRVDGLIIYSNYIKERSWLLELMDSDIPMVILESNFSDVKANCIYADNEYGGYIATKYLIELGHTQIAHIAGDLENQGSLERLEGYKNALLEANMPLRSELIEIGSYNGDDTYLAMKHLLEYRPYCTAVFVAHDEMGFRALRAIQEAGLSLPGDISVITYDDLEFSRYTSPPLTTIRQPRFEMGEQAMLLLVSLLKNSQNTDMGVKIRFTPELVVRGTTGSPKGHCSKSIEPWN